MRPGVLRTIRLVSLLIGLMPCGQAVAGETSLHIATDPRDPLSPGMDIRYTTDDGIFEIEKYGVDNAIVVWFHTVDHSRFWQLSFAAPQRGRLSAGFYHEAETYPFQPAGVPGLRVTGDVSICGGRTGDFQIKQIEYDGSGNVTAFWARFGQHCSGAVTGPSGEVRYNADVNVSVEAPASVSIERGHLVTIPIVADSPGGESLVLSAHGLPATATFRDNGDNTGAIRWTPRQFGAYLVEVEARSPEGAADRIGISIAVEGSTRLVIHGSWGEHLRFEPPDGFFQRRRNFLNGVSAWFSMPAHYVYWSLHFAGPDARALQAGAYPDAARFGFQEQGQAGMSVGGGCNTMTGSFDVQQVAYDSSGEPERLRVTFEQHCVEDGISLTGELRLDADVPVVLTAPSTLQTEETRELGFQVTAFDVDGHPVALEATALPDGAEFEDRGGGEGAFTWSPAPGQTGTHLVTIRADNGVGGFDTTDVIVTVNRFNQAPVASAGGPYVGVIGLPLRFNGNGHDADGDPLLFYWDFGDGSWAEGPATEHTYDHAGLYRATLYVYDGLLFSIAEVTVRIHESTAPDLTGEWSDARLHCPPQRARGKCHLLASLTITNQGIEDAAASRVHVFLSDDPIPGPGDILIQSFGIGRMTTSSFSERTISASLLREQVAGKFLVAVVDASEAITETDEANNTLVLGPLQATILSPGTAGARH